MSCTCTSGLALAGTDGTDKRLEVGNRALSAAPNLAIDTKRLPATSTSALRFGTLSSATDRTSSWGRVKPHLSDLLSVTSRLPGVRSSAPHVSRRVSRVV